MSRYTRRISPSVQAEIDAADAARTRGDAEAAFRHLERAHVLGQASCLLHVRVHGHMLRWAVAHRNPGEAAGQLWRLLAAAVATPWGWLPHGNTGGANVSGFRPMPVPPDLQRLMDAARR